MTALAELRERCMKDPDFRAEYDALHEEFAIAAAQIDARGQTHGSQAQVAGRMDQPRITVTAH